MGVYVVWILQEGFYEGTESGQSGLHVWYMRDFDNTEKKYEMLVGDVCK